ncbi:LytR family transcriptional regulator [Cryobacterium sandaracinum]|uniref:LytR family transcriptional regulator n=1 Tax=Cryobacterium sandaracinum TaxID=1259247 RepID=A0ABY2JKI6_9MICO|nr:LCP family protein [Cryobacterium sandaracinum]TFD06113.1 LytR family transcriptional regulator [Cryobacterium sandaracinum]
MPNGTTDSSRHKPPEPSPGGAHQAPRKRHPWRIALGVLVTVVLTTIAAGGIYAFSLTRAFDTGTEKISKAFPDEASRPPAGQSAPGVVGQAGAGPAAAGPDAAPADPSAALDAVPDGQAQNILLLGSDTRGATGKNLADIRGERSDTMMVVNVPADRKNLFVMSILRDSWVEVPGHGQAKINAALSWGGVPLAVQTVENLLGTRIDHVAVVDFSGFEQVTDALGGVNVDNPIGFDSYHLKGHFFDKGLQHLTGTEAIAFARERYAFQDGDFQRVRNQQLIIKSLLSAAMHKSVLADPVKTSGLLETVTPYLAVDDGFDSAYLTSLAWELRELRQPQVTFFTMPTDGTGTSGDGQSIVNVDWEGLDAVREGFQTDTLSAYRPELQTIG